MPVYQIFGPPWIDEIAHVIARTITEVHSGILKSSPDEVTCIFTSACQTFRGGRREKEHIRVLGYIAEGRSPALKKEFTDTLLRDLIRSPQLEATQFDRCTLAVTLVEMQKNSNARYAGPLTDAADQQWALQSNSPSVR